MLFPKTLEKIQGCQKKPRTQDWIEKPKILGENPRGGNAAENEANDFSTKIDQLAELLL